MEKFIIEIENSLIDLKPGTRNEAKKGLKLLEKLGASLWALHEDYLHKNEDMSSGFSTEWDAFVLGYVDTLYPSIGNLPLDVNDNVLLLFHSGVELGEEAIKSEKLRLNIEKNAHKARGIFIGDRSVCELLKDKSLRSSLGGYVCQSSSNFNKFGMVVDKNGFRPFKFAINTIGVGVRYVSQPEAWLNIGNFPYIEKVPQYIPYIPSEIEEYPITTLDDWKNGIFNNIIIKKIIREDGEPVYVMEPLDVDLLYDTPGFVYNSKHKCLEPVEGWLGGAYHSKFITNLQKERITKTINNALKTCNSFRCFIENGGVIPIELLEKDWVINTYNPV